MESYKKEFIEFMVDSEVLKFGEFTLKSGRKSPFFMDAGAYVTGSQLKKLGEYYAKAIHDNFGDEFEVGNDVHSFGDSNGQAETGFILNFSVDGPVEESVALSHGGSNGKFSVFFDFAIFHIEGSGFSRISGDGDHVVRDELEADFDGQILSSVEGVWVVSDGF